MSTNITNTTRIQTLPVELANQIAAGEVIERPASVLKELLENSLDAGSTDIEIRVKRGGIDLIRVQDNGCGIHKEDLALALSQHATSKILSLNDLENIASFGFRGEALASIASVSKLRLNSCTDHQEMAYTIEHMGRQGNVTLNPAPRILGTTIEVQSLFYNTPARRKFLRGEKTENYYLEEVFKKIALSHPAVAFRFNADEKLKKNLTVCKNISAYARRVSELCGKNFIENARYIESEANGLGLKGWLGGTHQLRSQADLQYFYVNQRMIKDKVVSHAIRQTFQTFYPSDRYPCYVLFLELDPARVDVNVHPTKSEVRFREARIVHAFISYCIQESLKQSSTEIKLERQTFLPIHRTPEAEQSSSVNNAIQSNTDILGKPKSLLKNEFLLLEKGQTWWILDIHALVNAHTIKLFRDLIHYDSAPSKPLLMPVSISFSHKSEMLACQKAEQLLNALGFEWNEISEHAIVLRALPTFLNKIPEDMDGLFKTVIKLTTQEAIIHHIANHQAEHLQVTLEDMSMMLKDDSVIDIIHHAQPPILQPLTAEKLRMIFKLF